MKHKTALYLVLYLTIALAFIAIRPYTVASTWLSSSDFHTCIEISSSLVALIAALACLIYYFGLKSRYYLIIGLGFLICGSGDFIHGLLSCFLHPQCSHNSDDQILFYVSIVDRN